MMDDPTKIKNNKNSAAAMPAILVRPPDFTLIMDCPIIAQPPIPPKKPVTVLAKPWATHSWLAPPRLPVISPTRFKVKRLSIKPIAAKMIEYGKMICSVSQVNGTTGIWNGGNPPSIEAMSPTRGTSKPKTITIAATIPIPARGAGITLVSFGK